MSTAEIMFCFRNCAPFLVVFIGVFQSSKESTTEIDLRDVLSDVIRSPNFPNAYPPSIECTWAVIAPNRYRIKIKFNAFKLRECASRSCNTSFQCDMLEMYDGASNTSRMIGRFCANQCPPSFYSRGNALWIRFKSSSTPNNSSVGFEAMLSTENMVLALLLPILGCILLLSIIIAAPVIVKCRSQRVQKSLSSSDRLCRSETGVLPMRKDSMPLLSRESEQRL